MNHPSRAAAAEHRKKGEPMCDICFLRCPHGTTGAYYNWRCSCDKCMAAMRAYKDGNRGSITENGRRSRLNNPCFYMVKEARRRARTECLPFSITVDDVVVQGECPVCGTAYVECGGPRGKRPSLDKMWPERGYIPGNVIVICLKCNRRKGDHSPDTLLEFALKIREVMVGA